MHPVSRRFPRSLLLGATFTLLLAGGLAHASTPTAATQADLPTAQTGSGSSTCQAPLILASGGLCCPGTQSSMEPCAWSKPAAISADTEKLKPVVVNGVQIPLPVIMQMIKKGLGRTWSNGAADRGVMVCKFSQIPGTRLPLLRCNTNYVHFQGFIKTIAQGHTHIKPSDRLVHCYFNCFLTRENIINSLVRYVNSDSHVARVLAALLDKAPAATATYSLRVAETVPMWLPKQHIIVDYPAYVTFVVGDGSLANIQFTKRKGTIRVEKRNVHYTQRSQRMNVGPSCTETASIKC